MSLCMVVCYSVIIAAVRWYDKSTCTYGYIYIERCTYIGRKAVVIGVRLQQPRLQPLPDNSHAAVLISSSFQASTLGISNTILFIG